MRRLDRALFTAIDDSTMHNICASAGPKLSLVSQFDRNVSLGNIVQPSAGDTGHFVPQMTPF
jgi:hypothetical protein